MVLSEAVLWVQWLHRGFLESVNDVTFITLDEQKFGSIIRTAPSAYKCAAKFAYEFANIIKRQPNFDDCIERGLLVLELGRVTNARETVAEIWMGQ